MSEVLPERLKESRTKKGMTQSEIAEMLNIKRSTYGEYERGKISPPIEKIEAISKILSVSPQYLIGWDKYENGDNTSESTVGKLIRRLREERQLTAAEFSKEIGISVSDLTEYETGVKPIPNKLLQMIANYFGMSVESFTGSLATYGNTSSVYISQRQDQVRIFELWRKELGDIVMTEEENKRLIEYAKFIVSQRKD